MLEKVKEYWWFGLLVGLCLFIAFFQNDKHSISLIQEVFIYELGDVISNDYRDYLQISKDFDEEVSLILDDIEFITEVSNEVGEYACTVSLLGEDYNFLIVIEDTVAPLVEISQDYVIKVNQEVEEHSLREFVKVEELQSFVIEFEDLKTSYSKAGIYTIHCVVTDASLNKTECTMQIEVVEDDVTVTVQNSYSNYVGDYKDVNVVVKEDTPQIDALWWSTLSDEEIVKTVVDSLVWKNEFTNKTYKGIQSLVYGFNIDDWAYGGLKLMNNPYGVQFSGYQFVGGVELITRNSFLMYWSYNGEVNRYVDCGLLTISIPTSVSADKVYEFYE